MARTIPRFSLYGEAAFAGQELLHIEDVCSRSSLYQWEIKPHIHQGLYQVLWVKQGSVLVQIDERQTELQGPAVIVVPPSVVHGFRFSPGIEGFVLTFSARLLVEGEFGSTGEAFRTLFSQPGFMVWSEGDGAAARLQVLFGEIAIEFNDVHRHDSPVVKLLARALVVKLAQWRSQQGPHPDQGSGHQALFTRFLLLVEQHFLEHWTVEQYASRLGLSVPRLNRLAQAGSGESAMPLIHQRLLRESCRRLAYIEAPLNILSQELGFKDPAYFSRFFKKHMGINPLQWRQRNRLSQAGD